MRSVTTEPEGDAGRDAPQQAFCGEHGCVSWTGVVVPQTHVDHLRSGPLLERMHDLVEHGEYADELRAMASTEMATEFVAEVLGGHGPPLGWEVGEALAETLLEHAHGAIWPWNTIRDKRTPKASLPGADLVGFVRQGEQLRLLFGEVKTSGDLATPPQVVTGRSGLARQIETLATSQRIQFSLLRYLRPRCKNTDFEPMFKEAVQRFVGSSGVDMHLIGCLMRDTQPAELDIRARAIALGDIISPPTQVQFFAWYMPEPIDDWPSWVEVDGDG